jgi:hypothetical protein
MLLPVRDAALIRGWRARLKRLCADLLDAIALSDSDLIGDCLLRLAEAVDDGPPVFPAELQTVIPTAAFLLSSDSPRVVAESLSLVASLTATSTRTFTALVIADAALVRAVIGHCLVCESSAGLIVANLCSESRENVDMIFHLIDLRQIGELLIEGEVGVEAKCGFAAIFAAVCSFQVCGEEANEILGFVRNYFEMNFNEKDVVDELFLIVSRLRMHTENAVELCWENGILNCINLIRTELSVGSIITILECYGEALQDELVVTPLDFHKLAAFVCHPHQRVADTAMWLMWNCVERYEHTELIDPDFIEFLFRTGESGTFSMLKHSLLIWSRLIVEASQTQISAILSRDFVDLAFEVLADEIDDTELQIELIKATVKLLSFEGEIECLTKTRLTTTLASQSTPTSSAFEELKAAIGG